MLPADLAVPDGERDRLRREVNWWRRDAARARAPTARRGCSPVPRFSRERARSALAPQPRPVRVRPLPVRRPARPSSCLALGDEDRVVAEAARAARLARDLALDHADGVHLTAVRGNRDERARDIRAARFGSSPEARRGARDAALPAPPSAPRRPRARRRARRPRSRSPRRRPMRPPEPGGGRSSAFPRAFS